MDKRDVLELYPFYQQASQREQENFLRKLMLQGMPVSHPVHLEGKVCQRFYLIGEGSIRVFKADSDGKEITIYHVRKGENCPLSAASMLTSCLYAATSEVEEDVKGGFIGSPDFSELVASSETFRKQVCKLVGSGIANLLHLVHELAFDTIESRLCWFLYRSFENQGNPRLTIDITHADIAAEVGYSREVVSRTLKQFERHGTIKLDRSRIRLLDSKSLSRTALTSKKKHLCNLCYRHPLTERCMFQIV